MNRHAPSICELARKGSWDAETQNSTGLEMTRMLYIESP